MSNGGGSILSQFAPNWGSAQQPGGGNGAVTASPMAGTPANAIGTGANTAAPAAPVGANTAAPAPGGGMKGGGYAAPQMTGGSVANTSANAYNTAVDATGSAMGFTPNQITAPTVGTGQIANTDLTQYTNPFQQQVIDNSINDLGRANEMAMNSVGAQAGNAFGGARHGVAEAETNRAFLDQAARTSSNLNQAGYQNAQNMAQFDVGAKYGADTFNASNNIAAQNSNVNNAFNANSNVLNSANQLAGLSQQGFNYNDQINKNMQTDGNAQQNLIQQIINAANTQYDGVTGFPQQMLNLPLAALGGAQYDTSSTKTKNPGLFDYMTLAATAAGKSGGGTPQ